MTSPSPYGTVDVGTDGGGVSSSDGNGLNVSNTEVGVVVAFAVLIVCAEQLASASATAAIAVRSLSRMSASRPFCRHVADSLDLHTLTGPQWSNQNRIGVILAARGVAPGARGGTRISKS